MERRSSWIQGLVVALGLAVALLVSARIVAAQSPTLSASSLTTGVGYDGIVSFDALKMAPPGLAAWTIDVSYDATVASAIACAGDSGSLCNPTFRDNTIRMTGVNIYGVEGDVHLADITFVCNALGTTELTISVVVLSDGTLQGGPQPIAAALAQGSVTCTAEPPATPPAAPVETAGDANCDGSVDGIDAALVLQLDASLIDSLTCERGADANGDGNVDGIDAALILQLDAGLLGSLSTS